MRKLRKVHKTWPIDFEEPKTQGFDESWNIDEEEEELDPERGLTLRNLFMASKNVVQENDAGRRSEKNGTNPFFDEIAGALNEWERKTGKKIDDEFFVMTMRRKYGEWLYPGHLRGREALNIYHKETKEVYRKMSTCRL
jgi:hypothetical protein